MNFEDTKFSDLSSTDQVRLGYLLLLRRPIDPTGLAYWAQRIEAGTYRLESFIAEMLGSPEYKAINRVPFPTMVHEARKAWIKEIGSFDKILDIGGSSPNIDLGAMIELGYPHRPRSLTIFDLPPEQQYWGHPRFPQDRDYDFAWGTIRYVHGSAELIGSSFDLAGERFDLIFMGQVIEHLEPAAVPLVLEWIRGHLSDSGKFIFDTPNRLVTKIQSPDKYTDPDHKIEYTPSELREILASAGFRLLRSWGLMHMPSTSLSGSFDPLEVYETRLITDRMDESYLVAFECAAE